MSYQVFSENIIGFNSAVAGPNLSNTTTATSIIPTSAKITLPNNYLAVGKILRLTLAGQLSNLVTTPGTLTLDCRIGGVIAFNGAAMQMSSTAHTTLPFWAQIMLTVRASGSSTSGNIMGQGIITSQALSLTAVADSTTTPATLLFPNTTPAVGTGYDSTAANTLDVFATFSIANAANAIQVLQYMVEALN